MDLSDVNILSLIGSFTIVLGLCFFAFLGAYFFNWCKRKIFSTQSRMENFFKIIKDTANRVNYSDSSQKLEEEIKKGNDLYSALRTYTEKHTFKGTNSLAHHLRYGVSRADSESYLQQLKSLAVEADRCSELIKDHISTVIKDVNEKQISPTFDQTTKTEDNKSLNQSQKPSNSSSNIPACQIDPNTIDNNKYYTFVAYDNNNKERKRFKKVKGSELKSLVNDVKNGNIPQQNIYPILTEEEFTSSGNTGNIGNSGNTSQNYKIMK